MYKRSSFPEQVQYFQEKRDMQLSDKINLDRFHALIMKDLKTPAEQDELNALTQTLASLLISAADFNILTDTMVAIQIAIKNKITELDLAWTDLVNNFDLLKQTIETTMAKLAAQYQTLITELNNWRDMTYAEIAKNAGFYFWNFSALPGVTCTTSYPASGAAAGGVAHEIRLDSGNLLVATFNITFPANGTIVEEESVYDNTGITVMRKIRMTRTFLANGNIQTKVVNLL